MGIFDVIKIWFAWYILAPIAFIVCVVLVIALYVIIEDTLKKWSKK